MKNHLALLTIFVGISFTGTGAPALAQSTDEEMRTAIFERIQLIDGFIWDAAGQIIKKYKGNIALEATLKFCGLDSQYTDVFLTDAQVQEQAVQILIGLEKEAGVELPQSSIMRVMVSTASTIRMYQAGIVDGVGMALVVRDIGSEKVAFCNAMQQHARASRLP